MFLARKHLLYQGYKVMIFAYAQRMYKVLSEWVSRWVSIDKTGSIFLRMVCQRHPERQRERERQCRIDKLCEE